MRRLFVTLALAGAVAAVLTPASASELWSCEHDGRLAGRPDGQCQGHFEAGSYELRLETFGRDTSGEARITVEEDGAARIDLVCTIAATVFVSCETTQGPLAVTASDATLGFEVTGSTTVSFRVRPNLCDEATCGNRVPVIARGRIIATVSAAA